MEGQNTEEKKTETEVKKTQNEVELENALFPDLQEQFEEITKEEEYEIVNKDESSEEEKPLWHDDDDDTLNVNLVETNRLRKLRKTEDEIEVNGAEYNKRLRERLNNNNEYAKIFSLSKRRKLADDDDDEIFRKSLNFIKESDQIGGGKIRVKKLQDANISGYSNCVIQSVRFHPSKNIMLTAGLDKNLRLFNVDGEKNEKLVSVYFEDLPILCANWTNYGNEIVLGGKRHKIYIYDVNSQKTKNIGKIENCADAYYNNIVASPSSTQFVVLGQKGGMYVLDSRVGMNVANLRGASRMNGGQYTMDGTTLYTASFDGLLYSWDMRTQECLSVYKDSSILTGTTFAMNQNSQFAIGCTSGVLNMYDFKSLSSATTENQEIIPFAPVKMFNNLTTCITSIAFNKQNTICAYSSRSNKDQLRLIHLPSMSVYSNWPTSKTPLRYVNSIDFNYNSEYLAMGNDKGQVVLYSLAFYANKRKETEAKKK